MLVACCLFLLVFGVDALCCLLLLCSIAVGVVVIVCCWCHYSYESVSMGCYFCCSLVLLFVVVHACWCSLLLVVVV